jgi:hypothetical protein
VVWMLPVLISRDGVSRRNNRHVFSELRFDWLNSRPDLPPYELVRVGVAALSDGDRWSGESPGHTKPRLTLSAPLISYTSISAITRFEHMNNKPKPTWSAHEWGPVRFPHWRGAF